MNKSDNEQEQNSIMVISTEEQKNVPINAEEKDDNDIAAEVVDESAEIYCAEKEIVNNEPFIVNGDCEQSSEHTPLKRLTRSAKRKSLSNQEVRANELNIPMNTRKRSKKELSPVFD